MKIFQNSVLNKYLKTQDEKKIDEMYSQFTSYFHNAEIQDNIRNSKEEQFQEGFLRELFVKILGYTLNPQPNFNLTTELKNEKDSRKVDGAILKPTGSPVGNKVDGAILKPTGSPVGNPLAVIELKSTKTKDLDKINEQAFNYKNNHTDCVYVITSNFEKLRFFIHNAVAHIEFNLFTLTKEEFQIFWLCLSADNLLVGVPEKVKQESTIVEENVTKQLYKDYSTFKHELWQNICKNRPDLDKLLLFKKTQKLLDRFLFVLFAEDSGLLPPNSISRMVERFDQLIELDAQKPLYEIFKQYFGYINKGRKGKTAQDDIFAYNGGLFLPDELLDSLIIDDKILKLHVLTMTAYDFESDVDVNILGHIFENSLNEIEEIERELLTDGLTRRQEGSFNVDATDGLTRRQDSKRKKDGVFYTPKYITKYIVENTVGKLCEDKKAELQIIDEEYAKGRKNRKKATVQALYDNLQAYRNWLLQLTICDPACGSGAFLNQALEFLIDEHAYIDELQANLLEAGMVLQDVSNQVLEKNIFGVDINDESVEIAKLSLWLRTAQRGRKLTSLNNNIKCGNSLIDDPEIAGEKAFNWQKEFPQVFQEKEKTAWHITFCLHNSRYSTDADGLTRRFGGDTTKTPGFIARTYPELSAKQEVIIAEELAKAAEEYKLNITECNICKDHVHAIIVCEEEELSYLVGKWKGRSAFTYNRRVNPSADLTDPYNRRVNPSAVAKQQAAQYADGTIEKFWAKSFKPVLIKDKEQYNNTVNYIKNNRQKHQLPTQTDGFTRRLEQMCCTYEHAFRTEYKGGFDVILGNPPYVRLQGLKANYETESLFYEKNYKSATSNYDIYVLFLEKSLNLIKRKGKVSYILPHKFLISEFGKGIRGLFSEKKAVESLLHFGSEMVFADASTYTCILNLSNGNNLLKFKQLKPQQIDLPIDFDTISYEKLSSDKWNLNEAGISNVLDKLNKQPLRVKDVFAKIFQGIATSGDDVYLIKGKQLGSYVEGYSKALDKNVRIETGLMKPMLKGEDISKYKHLENQYFVIFPYLIENGKAGTMTEEYIKQTFPLGYEYLKENETFLRGREKGRFDNEKEWFLFGRKQGISGVEQPKIITSYMGINSNMTFDTSTFYHNTKCYSFVLKESSQLNYVYYLAIFNSNLFWFFIKNTSTVFRGGYYTFATKQVEPFPLPKLKDISEQNIFIEKADLMLSLNKELQTEKSNFINSLQEELAPTDGLTRRENNATLRHPLNITKKLDAFNQLEYDAFKKELLKQKVKISLGNENNEWREYFNTTKQKVNELQNQINQTDKEIDKMVYELYELTAEEIEIVENSVK